MYAMAAKELHFPLERTDFDKLDKLSLTRTAWKNLDLNNVGALFFVAKLIVDFGVDTEPLIITTIIEKLLRLGKPTFVIEIINAIPAFPSLLESVQMLLNHSNLVENERVQVYSMFLMSAFPLEYKKSIRREDGRYDWISSALSGE